MSGGKRLVIVVVAVAIFVGAVIVKEMGRSRHDDAREPDATTAGVMATGADTMAAGAVASAPQASEARPVQVEPGLPRLVDLGSTTCIPCKKMAPILDELAREYAEEIVVEVIDVRKDRAAAPKYGIRVIPTQIFFDAEGEERFRHEGFMSKAAILAKWAELDVRLAPGDSAQGGS